MLLSVWGRPGILRIAGLLFFLQICGFEWFLVAGSQLPAFTGLAQVGQNLPAFSTTFADGSSFTDKNLQSDGRTMLIFFRGHW